MVKVNLNIRGTVQGVFFRANAQKKAEELKLEGYVKNLSDGSVEVVAQGLKERVDEFVEYCTSGCERGIVEDIDIEYSDDEEEFEGFKKIH